MSVYLKLLYIESNFFDRSNDSLLRRTLCSTTADDASTDNNLMANSENFWIIFPFVIYSKKSLRFLFLCEIVLSGARAFIVPSSDYVYVHRTSPSTRTFSPTSRADRGYVGIKDANSYIWEKYGETMNVVERRALQKRQQAAVDWLEYMDLLEAIRSGNFKTAWSIFIKKPSLACIKFYTVRNRLQDLWMIRASGKLYLSHLKN